MKIRGNAHHVAEKYLQLARDAHTSSDPVAAENYLQHAEHYFRLIAAAQAAQQQQNGSARPPGEGDAEDLDDEDDFGGLSDRFASPAERAPPAPYQSAPGFVAPAQAPQPQSQPYQDRAPYDNDRQPPGDRGFQGRPDRPNNRQPDRGPRDGRPYQERQESQQRDNRDNRFPRDNRPREFRPYRDPNVPRETAGPPEPPVAPALPSFITAPPRANAQPDVEDAQFASPIVHAEQPQPVVTEAPEAAVAPFAGAEGEPRFPARGRRRRVRPTFGFDSPAEGQPASAPESSQKDDAPAGE